MEIRARLTGLRCSLIERCCKSSNMISVTFHRVWCHKLTTHNPPKCHRKERKEWTCTWLDTERSQIHDVIWLPKHLHLLSDRWNRKYISAECKINPVQTRHFTRSVVTYFTFYFFLFEQWCGELGAGGSHSLSLAVHFGVTFVPQYC